MLHDVNVVANYSLQSETIEAIFIRNIYIIGIIVFISLFLFKLFGIYKVLHRSKFINKGMYKIVEVSEINIAFSFLKYIIISADFRNEEEILSHELVHVNQKHSLDVIVINILQVILWFNPIIYFYTKAIQENHEYIADKEVIKHHSAGGYLQLLLSQTMSNTVSVMSCFAKSNLKKRVIMMKKQKNMKYALLKYISAFTLPVVMFFAVSVCNEASAAENIKSAISKVTNVKDYSFKADNSDQFVIGDTVVTCKAKVMMPSDVAVVDEQVLVRAEQMPTFPGGTKAMYKFLGKSVKYPAEAQKNNIKGRVFIGFVIEKNGSISNVKVLRPVNPFLDKEALRVVKSMPKWNPGVQSGKIVRVSYTVPINFSLRSMKKTTKVKKS
jgi:TonB family protein